MNQQEAKKIIQPFYEMLNKPQTKDLKALGEIIAPHWKSFAGENMSKGKEEFLNQVAGFGKLIPDLEWAIQDVLVDGNKIIVRSQAKGTPIGDFFGIPPSGKTFSIMTIDIHTTEGGRLVEAQHVEDWATAFKQLK